MSVLVYAPAMHRYLLFSLMLGCFTASAGIYKWVDEEGNVHYSDQEEKGAEPVELPKTVTFSPPTASTQTSSKSAPVEGAAYSKMAIVKPEMNETIRNSNGVVAVAIELTPALMPGDSITLYLDGNAVVKGANQTATTLTQVERGSHTLRASVYDKNGAARISSSSIIFHLKIEAGKSEDHSPEDNSEAFKPDFKQDGSKKANYDKDFEKDFSDDFSKDYDSSDTYKEGAEKYKKGIPANSGNFKPGTSTYTPNYNQK